MDWTFVEPLSMEAEMGGQELFNTVVENTGLAESSEFSDEFTRLLAKHNVNPDTMSLDDLRMVVADYLQDVMLECKQRSR